MFSCRRDCFLFGKRCYLGIDVTLMATHQQSIYCAPLLRLHFSSPVFVPHYYGHTWAVHLCPAIIATHRQSSHRAPLLWPHTRSPASVFSSFDRTSTIQSSCSPVRSTLAAQSGSQYNGYTSSFHLLCSSIMATHRQPSFSLPLFWPHIKNPVMVLPFCGHTGCPVRLPPFWQHTISPVVVLTPTALRIDMEIRWSV
jgi:hypothetical protein